MIVVVRTRADKGRPDQESPQITSESARPQTGFDESAQA
jgi:hypothetical protein